LKGNGADGRSCRPTRDGPRHPLQEFLSPTSKLPGWLIRASFFSAVAVGLILRLSWASMLPYNDAPDEFCHWPMVAYLANHGRPPTMSDVPTPIPVSYPALCPVGYLVPAIGAWLLGPDHPDAFFAARVMQASLSVLFLLLTFVATRELVPPHERDQHPLPHVVTWLAAIHPQLVFTFAYVNNDASMLAVAMALWWSAVAMMERGLTPRRLFCWSALFALTILCKTNAIGLSVMILPIALFAPRETTDRRDFLRLVRSGLAGFLVTILPWTIWSIAQHHSLLGFEVHARWWRRFIEERQITQGFLQFDKIDRFLIETWESAWASFGYASVSIPAAAYFVIAVLLGGAMAIHSMVRTNNARCGMLLFVGTIGVWLAHVYHSRTVGLTPQGRYVLPAMWPILVFLGSAAIKAGSTPGRSRLYCGVLILMIGWMQYLSWHAEDRSNRLRQPDRRVGARLISYAGDLPGRAEPNIHFLPLGTIATENRGDRLVLHLGPGGGLRWPTPVRARAVGALILDQHYIGGTLPHGRLRVLSASGAEVPLGEIKYTDPTLGRIRYRFDLRSISQTLGNQMIWIEYYPSDEPADVVIDRWSLLGPDFEPLPDG
jgi:hypothetical protein